MNPLVGTGDGSGAAVAWLVVVYIALAAAAVLFVAGVVSVARAGPDLDGIVVRVTTAFFERHLRHRSEPILDIPTDYYAELEDRTDTIG